MAFSKSRLEFYGFFLKPTFSRARDAVSFEVACAFLPAVLLSVGVGGRRGVQLGAGGAGYAGAGTHRISQARVYSWVGGKEKGRKINMLLDFSQLIAGIQATTPGCSQILSWAHSRGSPNNSHHFLQKNPNLAEVLIQVLLD